MVFIDAGYLLKELIEMYRHDDINYGNLIHHLGSIASFPGTFLGLIRAYYYDAIPEATDKNYAKQMDYLKGVKTHDYIEVREGRAIRKGNGRLTQKGVDTLITIDMLTKAYTNQYDVAVLLTGDADFLDLVYEVKNTGKQIWGAFFEKNVSEPLRESFDKEHILVDAFLGSMMNKKPPSAASPTT